MGAQNLRQLILGLSALFVSIVCYQNAGIVSSTAYRTARPALWYQYNVEIPSLDHAQMYNKKNLRFTALALARTRVHMISRRLWMDTAQRQFFMTHVVPILQARGINLAINSPAALWMGCRSQADAISGLESEAAVITAIEASTKLKVTHLALQSIMSRPSPAEDPTLSLAGFPNCQKPGDYTLDMRANDVVDYVQFMAKRFPDLKVGTIDALLAHEKTLGGELNYAEAYGVIYRRLQARSLNLGFVLVDHPYEYLSKGSSVAALRAMVGFFKRRSIPTGLIVTSKILNRIIDPVTGKDITMERFQTKSRTFMNTVARANLGFDFYLQTSWFPEVNQDRPQLELVVDFSDIIDGGAYSHYRKCTRTEYFDADPSIRAFPKYRTNPLKHFNESGKYRGRCAPIL